MAKKARMNSRVLGKEMQIASFGEIPRAASLAWKERTFERRVLCENFIGEVLEGMMTAVRSESFERQSRRVGMLRLRE